jgi:protein SCO1/2
MKTRTIVIASVAVLAGLALAFLINNLLFPSYTYQGSVIDPPLPAWSLELLDQDGETFRLSDQRGKVVMIYFGYTFCPDVCPTTLTDLKYVYENLDEQAQDVEVVFVTVDPPRDTREHVKSYLSSFNPDFIGLVDTTANMQDVWERYGVYVEAEETGDDNYLVDHSSRVYVIDPNGGFALSFPFGMEREAMLDDITFMLKNQ